jgi:hypothetical protein
MQIDTARKIEYPFNWRVDKCFQIDTGHGGRGVVLASLRRSTQDLSLNASQQTASCSSLHRSEQKWNKQLSGAMINQNAVAGLVPFLLRLEGSTA